MLRGDRFFCSYEELNFPSLYQWLVLGLIFQLHLLSLKSFRKCYLILSCLSDRQHFLELFSTFWPVLC
ncbi:MAG: hypothetical protein O4804_18045 [Trichodesmium sp. St11_bin5]|nr:hypothetical protein [Trichodesmium sp. St11_bin5]